MNIESHAITTNIIKQWDQDLLFKILDNIHDIVMVLDSNTTIVYLNNAYAKILGVPVDKVLGRRLDSIEPNALAISVLRTGEVNHNLRDHIASVGIDVIGSGFPLFDGEKIVGCVSIFNNISEVVQLSRELQRTKQVADYLQDQLNQREQLPLSFKEYVGRTPNLRETLELAAKVARTDSTVLIRGESGAGKGVLAKAIHNSSRRKDKPLIVVNCAAIPEALLESELFGYEEGAFSGAKKGGKLGKFELAHGGTIFLDEIGDMSISMQAKLLRVLQEKELERLGGTKTIKLDIRVIAATNRDLEKMITDGTFRQDLYYRLNIVPLNLPPLRERKDDIIVLAEKFLAQFSEESGDQVTLAPEVVRILAEYDWPGNVRELQNAMEHASIVRSGAQIEVQHLPTYLRTLYQEHQPLQEKPCDAKEALANLERELMVEALAKNRNNRSAAMRELGMSRRAFYDKLRKYNIDIQKIDN
ncbi:MAG: domain S-box [Firmicutes bacterium]|nr:domain S-box [Bacillota bacterium]